MTREAHELQTMVCRESSRSLSDDMRSRRGPGTTLAVHMQATKFRVLVYACWTHPNKSNCADPSKHSGYCVLPTVQAHEVHCKYSVLLQEYRLTSYVLVALGSAHPRLRACQSPATIGYSSTDSPLNRKVVYDLRGHRAAPFPGSTPETCLPRTTRVYIILLLVGCRTM